MPTPGLIPSTGRHLIRFQVKIKSIEAVLSTKQQFQAVSKAKLIDSLLPNLRSSV